MSCGPRQFGDAVVPDSIWGLDISMACAIHDDHYERGGNDIQRKIADDTFYANMLEFIDKTGGPWWLRLLRKWRAWTYYRAVRRFGYLAWRYDD